MTETKFTFDKETSNVLGAGKQVGRPKTPKQKKKHVACYLTEEEHEQVLRFLDGRPLSVYLRQLLLDTVVKNK